MARWEEARSAAVRIPCRAIAVDGPVHEQGAGDAGAALAQQGEIPTGVWLSLAQSARLVAKDPRTTRETAFVGPALVRVCVAHREESWLATGRFESAIGAGETPGAEEWVVTPLGVIRYMAAKVAVDVRAKDAVVGVGSGVAFMWLDDGVHATVRRGRRRAGAGADAGAGARVDAGAGLDDDGWQRVSDGEVTLSPGAAQGPCGRGAGDRRPVHRALEAVPGPGRDPPCRVRGRGRQHRKRADADPPPGAGGVRRRRAACRHSAPIGSQGRNVGPARGRDRRLGRGARGVAPHPDCS